MAKDCWPSNSSEQSSTNESGEPCCHYRVFLGVSVEDLRLLPGVQGVVDQGGQHHVVVEVGAVGVLVQVDRVQEDPQSVGGEARDGVPECDAVTWQSELNTESSCLRYTGGSLQLSYAIKTRQDDENVLCCVFKAEMLL